MSTTTSSVRITERVAEKRRAADRRRAEDTVPVRPGTVLRDVEVGDGDYGVIAVEVGILGEPQTRRSTADTKGVNVDFPEDSGVGDLWPIWLHVARQLAAENGWDLDPVADLAEAIDERFDRGNYPSRPDAIEAIEAADPVVMTPGEDGESLLLWGFHVETANPDGVRLVWQEARCLVYPAV